MVNFLVVTHGDFGSYGVEAAEAIVGEQREGVRSIPITARMTVDEARAKVARAIDALHGPDGLIILTDIPGGTPSNLCVPLVQDKPRATVLSGLNLYMLVTGFAHRTLPVDQLAEKMLACANRSIMDMRKLLERRLKA